MRETAFPARVQSLGLRPTWWTSARSVSLAAAFLSVAAGPAFAQTDNFDDGNDDGWTRVNVLAPYGPLAGGGGVATYGFPPTSTGTGIRIQATSVVPLGEAGTARAYNLWTNLVYSDFYVALDIAGWDNTKNQALLILARGSGFDEVGANCEALLGSQGLPCFPGMLALNGYVLNYDNLQDGVGTGDRLGGQFQINRVDGELPETLAAAELTLVPGRPYRLVFMGVGGTLTGRIYDIEDLTAPLVTIIAEDATYPSGICGFASYSRDTTVSDVTYDNYLGAAANPDADIAPAIRHVIAGTPQVVTRTPAKRFTNFLPVAGGISFSARTFAENQINAAATRLYLNDVDVSNSLAPLPANASTCTFQTASGTLKPNTVYAARIELQDVSGALKSTNTFWFDTFTTTYLTTSPVKTIEAEDYNFSFGYWTPDPIPVAGYLSQAGVEGVDLHDNRTSPEGGWAEYRDYDPVGTTQGGKEEIEDLMYPPDADPSTRPGDTPRPQYISAGLLEYQVVRTEAGEWLNYTREFVATNYNVYLRVGSFGATQATLDLVGGDPTTTEQTLTPLGTFDIPNQLMRLNYHYVPLMNEGKLAAISLGGTNTVRLTMGGIATKHNRLLALNYLLFVPAPQVALTLVSAPTVAGPFVAETGAAINEQQKTITVPQLGGVRFYQLQAAQALKIKSISVQANSVMMTYE